jgi:hypothetical protein
MNNFSFWQRWLFVFSLVVIVFGMGMALLNRTPLFGVFDRQVDPVFWGANLPPSGVNEFQGWVYGVLGATMAGWGVLLAFVVQASFRKRERWAWNAVILSLALWYLTDTFLSLRSGVAFNAVFNTAILVLAALPLFFTRREFLSANSLELEK